MTFNDKIEQLDKKLKELRKELESDLAKYRDPHYLSFHMSEEAYWASKNNRIDVRVNKECKPWIKLGEDKCK